MNINVIFLDVDGVLNCSDTIDKCDQFVGIEDQKVEHLKKIKEQTKAHIVLVSSWKEYWFPKQKSMQDDLANYLDNKLARCGLKAEAKTYEDDHFLRGKGIKDFIRLLKTKNINVLNYVILDDEEFDYQEEELDKHLIKTSFTGGGLMKEHVSQAIEILNSSNK